jgi:hypothetical protein
VSSGFDHVPIVVHHHVAVDDGTGVGRKVRYGHDWRASEVRPAKTQMPPRVVNPDIGKQ